MDIYDDGGGRVNRFRCIETARISRAALSDRSANWTERRPVHVHGVCIYIYRERERGEREEREQRRNVERIVAG